MGLKKYVTDAYQRFMADVSAQRQERRLQEKVFHDINKFIKKNCPKMTSVPGYHKKLVHAISVSLTHISGLIDQIPGPVDLESEQWEKQPVLQSMFVKPEEIDFVLKSSKYLNRYFKTTGAAEAVALLTATLKEKTVFGIEKNDGMIRRDVPKKAVYFEGHEIFGPARTIEDSRFRLKHLALISLCRQVVQNTTGLESWKKELEEQQNLLEFKLHPRMHSDQSEEKDEKAPETAQLLSDIKSKIKSINNQINVTEAHLDRITRVFENPQSHLMLTTETMKLDRLGIRLNPDSKQPANEFSIAEFQFGKTPKIAGIWVRIKRASLPQQKRKHPII